MTDSRAIYTQLVVSGIFAPLTTLLRKPTQNRLTYSQAAMEPVLLNQVLR